MPRPDGRSPDQLREVRMTPGWLEHAEGSVLIEFGSTPVRCAASRAEDVAAQTDMNVVCTGDGQFVEIQGTAEREPFSRELLDQLLGLGVAGCAELTRAQRAALGR